MWLQLLLKERLLRRVNGMVTESLLDGRLVFRIYYRNWTTGP